MALVAPRQHKVEKSRVASIIKGYAMGGSVNNQTAPLTDPNPPVPKKVRATAMVEGKAAKRRADRPHRAAGGAVGKATTVNVVVNAKPEEKPEMMMPPPPPPMPPPGPPPGPPMPPPGMGGPPMGGMPMRKAGGRVKSGPAWATGLKNGTQVSHDIGKVDTDDMKRPGMKPGKRTEVVTYATGGKVHDYGKTIGTGPTARPSNPHPDSPEGRKRASGGAVFSDGKPGKQMGPKLPGGVGSGEGRLAQAARAKRK